MIIKFATQYSVYFALILSTNIYADPVFCEEEDTSQSCITAGARCECIDKNKTTVDGQCQHKDQGGTYGAGYYYCHSPYNNLGRHKSK